jgi:DnaK suppressor protein
MLNILPPFILLCLQEISKKYIPNKKEKYMCEKHKAYFIAKLTEWKNEIIKSNSQALYSSDLVDNISSPDVVDQASSYTEKNVEMRTVNRQIKLVSKIDAALKRLKDGTYGFCEETGEPIGLKRLIARPIATLCIAAQENTKEKKKFTWNYNFILGIFSPVFKQSYPFFTAHLLEINLYHLLKCLYFFKPISCHSCLATQGKVAISAIE